MKKLKELQVARVIPTKSRTGTIENVVTTLPFPGLTEEEIDKQSMVFAKRVNRLEGYPWDPTGYQFRELVELTKTDIRDFGRSGPYGRLGMLPLLERRCGIKYPTLGSVDGRDTRVSLDDAHALTYAAGWFGSWMSPRMMETFLVALIVRAGHRLDFLTLEQVVRAQRTDFDTSMRERISNIVDGLDGVNLDDNEFDKLASAIEFARIEALIRR